MSDESGAGADLEELKSAVREAVASGRDLQDRVRQLMIASMHSMGVDMSRMQETIRAALEGVEAGISPQDSGATVRQAVAGIEDALVQAAEASSLAIREAAGHAGEFARDDLKRAIDELATLEQRFIQTLAAAGKAGSQAAQAGFADMQRHLEASGSAFGAQLTTHVGTLRELLAQRGQEGLQAGADAAVKTAEQLGKLAASLLTGIGQGLADGAAAPDGEREHPAGKS